MHGVRASYRARAMTYQELLKSMADQGTIALRVKVDKPPRHSNVNTGVIEKIDLKGVAVRMDDMSWNSWFRTDIDSDDQRSRYIRELQLCEG